MALPTNFYEAGEAFIESFMDDECTIRRDKAGVWDDVMDEDTLELVPNHGDDSLVYAGMCLLKPVATRDMYYEDGSQPVYRKVYNLYIPRSAAEVFIGDTVKIVESTRDSTLNDVEMRVMEYRKSTHSVYRYIRVEDVQQDYNPTNPIT